MKVPKEPDETDYDKYSSKFRNNNNLRNKKPEELKTNRYDNNKIAPAKINDFAAENEDSGEQKKKCCYKTRKQCPLSLGLSGFFSFVIGLTVGASIIHNIPQYIANYLPNANINYRIISYNVY